ncbi:MAG: nucleotidyl transferase AbiEii/AbiGii toxin family protein [Deltaproteobacteria bacterium]|nr:nucleotidyl transferase AbiEii/AbiGii toxin family protein [Deltaproteobacteria bacterium]
MIKTSELHRTAAREGLRFDQVEKDYIILLILSALSETLGRRDQWVFKGGTCLRHCYYPGYRFSEDIDFSCTRTEDNVRHAFDVLVQAVGVLTEKTGIMLRCKEPRADEENAQVEIPIEYSRGGSRRQSLPAVKVHLSFREPLLTSAEERLVRPFHAEPMPFSLAAYSLIEIVAEKLRALLQQQEKWPRPRDLYDLWYITCHEGESFDRDQLRRMFEKKCQVRGIPADTRRLHSKQLYEWNRGAWTNQLLTMLRTAPEYDLVWTEWASKCELLL